MDDSKLFSIGEMSKLHNLSIQTLRYYDEIGLLIPARTRDSSGYRYYSTGQFEQLNTIRYLKELGFSLKEIRYHLEHRDIEQFMQLLEKQKEITENKIRELQRTADQFAHRMQEIRWAQNLGEQELETVYVRTLPRRSIVRLQHRITSEPELEICLRQLENRSGIRFSFIGGVGLTISSEHVREYKFREYNFIFILTGERDHRADTASLLPEGNYACIHYRGPRSLAPDYYEILLAEIGRRGLEIAGDSIERTLIDQYISRDPQDHITEIQIPVK
ncbi:MerR family transcriptional regulator [Paenibacillus sp. MMS20-IR301]|uniref:MerR family transcriptional regulator n=1 Tax=Paenibacillus sp. MMS20-IR301 TaxID=2895946 RepID=UPI0028EA534D|nr:MerR family transcriptional regulator [Paenibacillus sp. MMS20-IR301]WNS40733.1 MerR family transcriptional regulator [Paenibacillus sp. MMS20-IR301]